MSLITEETATLDRKYLADDLTFSALYLGLDVRNTRCSTYRNITGCGASVEIREASVYIVHGISGLYKYYTPDAQTFYLTGMAVNVSSSRFLARMKGVHTNALSTLTEYMYGTTNDR
jgi:hypothetical protein